MSKLINAIKANRKNYDLWAEEESVLVAVSGGGDSMALLSAVQCLGYSFQVAHMNYQLRGEDSMLDEKLVTDYCKANGIKWHTKRVHLEGKTGIQEAARQLRYEWFSQLLESENLSAVLTAHHVSDQAETVLFNLCRGTGISGVSGMQFKNASVVRPMLDVSKEAIEEHLNEHEVPFKTDASNLENKYKRNFLRNEVIPALQNVNNAAVQHLSSFSHKAQEVNELLKDAADKYWESNNEKTESGWTMNLQALMNKKYARSLLFQILERFEPKESIRSSVTELLNAQSGREVKGTTYCFYRDRNQLIIGSEKSSLVRVKLNKKDVFDLGKNHLEISISEFEISSELGARILYLPQEYLGEELEVRNWQEGDRFQPFGIKGSQKVSDFLIQRKVPLPDKEDILVLTYKNEILWVLGYRAAESTRFDSNSYKLLKLFISV